MSGTRPLLLSNHQCWNRLRLKQYFTWIWIYPKARWLCWYGDGRVGRQMIAVIVSKALGPSELRAKQYIANFAKILAMLPYMIRKMGLNTWRSLLKFVYRRRTQAFMDWLGFADYHWGAGLMQCFNSALYNICMLTVIRARTCFQ